MPEKIYTALGLMSGTSMDGIDVAVIKTDGSRVFSVIPGKTYHYTDSFRLKLNNLINGSSNQIEIEEEITHLHADAVKSFLSDNPQYKNSIDIIGFHGHTIKHNPSLGVTVQIGNGELLYKITKIPVAYDFRSADVKAGGHGAPLMPIYHQAILAKAGLPVVVVNIGGVSNITWIGRKEGELIAFDTGPGNALLDDWVFSKTGKYQDTSGELSMQGKVDEDLLQQYMAHNYFNIKPPKSLDRNDFKGIEKDCNISLEDGAATLSAVTAKAISFSADYFPYKPNKWVISGGGRHNNAIMHYLQQYISEQVIKIDELKIDGDSLEAQGFAFLAVRSMLKLPISFPGTTGVSTPLNGGVIIGL